MGIRKGLIVNLEQAIRSVRNAVWDAETMVGFKLNQAMVSFNADEVQSVMTDGLVALSNEMATGRAARPVRVDDMERVITVAQTTLHIPPNRIALHTIPVRYSIDGNSGIDDPLGMAGMRLGMDLQTITIPMTHVHNVVNCVESAGVVVEGLVIKPIAAALGALSEEEMSMGAISICIGGGTTGLTFYKDGRPIKVGIVPIGGDHITSDLASTLRLPLNKAEDLKKNLFLMKSDEPIVLAFKGQQQRVIDPNAALEVIRCRLEELFTVNVAPLVPEQYLKLFPAGIVLSGGVAKTPGIGELLSDIFKMPVRIADPWDSYQMPPGRNDTSYIGATGTIRYILSKERNPYRFIDAPVSEWWPGDDRRSGQGSRRSKIPPGWGKPQQSSRLDVRNVVEKIKETLKELF
jgi:cell division protein FtsA